MRYEHSEDGLAAYAHVLRILETGLYGSSGLSTCMKRITTRTFPGKQDPVSIFTDMRVHWVRFNRMSPKYHTSSMVMFSVAVCVPKDNPIYNTSAVLKRDLKDVDFDDLEKRVMDDYHEHILHMGDTHKMRPKSRMASDISGALDSAFGVDASHHPCPFCPGGFVYHRLRDCHVPADVIRSGQAYKHDKIDPLEILTTTRRVCPLHPANLRPTRSIRRLQNQDGEVLIGRGIDAARVEDGVDGTQLRMRHVLRHRPNICPKKRCMSHRIECCHPM